jgi:hypothetical protein
MARYDWPPPPRTRDDPARRGTYLGALRPGVDPTAIVPLTMKKTSGRGRRAKPHNAPTGNQYLWFPIGPTSMAHGQAGGNPNVAGRIRDLQIEPTQGRRIYAASAGGGVWFSADRGDSWRPLDDWQVTPNRNSQGNVATALACGAVHVNWGGAADGSADVVWVGTGEPALTDSGTRHVASAEPGAPQIGWEVAGIGLLNRDPAAAGGSWTVVKGDTAADTLRGEACYRITADPGNAGQLIAATTKGLYLLPPGGPWTQLPGFVASRAMQPLDVVLTRLTGPDRVRIWVATGGALSVAEFAGAPATAINPVGLTFSPVTLPDVTPSNLQLATDGTKVYVLGREVIVPATKRKTPPAAVWRVDATATIAGLGATKLTGAPVDLFMSAGDQSNYDMCICTHPSVANRIFIGGAAAGTSTGWNGAIYRCDVTGTALNPIMIGEGTHSDVHVLAVGGAVPSDLSKRSVWTGTDGGVFRSDADGDAGSFRGSNNGLAVLQPGFVANHPTNPGIVVAGFQDNGTAMRVGDGLWHQDFGGDGGGVAYDPASTNRYFRQYTAATWQSSDNGSIPPVERRHARQLGTAKTSETLESESSLFYSGAAALVHGGDTHLALGSDRVWYSRDWGRSWVTLPTGTDPRGGDNPNLRQDVLDPIAGSIPYTDRVGSTDCCASDYAGTGINGTGIITVRLSAAPNDSSGKLVLRVLALDRGGLVWLTGSRAPGLTTPFGFGALAGVPRQQVKRPVAASADETAFAAGTPLTFLPAPGVVSDVCVHDPARGTLGSCYVTTTGFPYIRTGGPTIPLDTLWFFDGVGTWRPTGLSTSFAPSNGTWTTPAEQVTAPALAVVVDADDRNTVYVGTGVGVVQGRLTIGGTAAAPTFAWTWTQLMNGLPEAVVQDLSIFNAAGVKLLRAATQARGVWELDIANSTVTPLSYLRLYRTDTRRVLPTPTGGDLLDGDPDNPTHWDDSPDVIVDSGLPPSTPPSEIELAAISPPGGPDGGARVSLTSPHVRVHVLAHHRVGDQSLASNTVRIALVRHAMPANGVVPLGGLWPALKAAAVAAAQPASLPDGWSAAGAALWQNPAGTSFDPRLPRAVTFDVDLSDAAGSAVALVAVVMNTSNQISDADLSLGGANQAQSADQLVVASPHVAAKSVLVP